MLTYATLKKKPKELLALTGLARREFDELLPVFAQALAQAEPSKPKRKKRLRAPGGGRKPGLGSVEDKLLFILVYTKTYPLQVVQGQLFGMSQNSASDWIHRLLPVLTTALETLGVMPEREGAQLAQAPQPGDRRDWIVDGVERRRQRPKDPKTQQMHYSGKKKYHTDKNVIVVNTASRRVDFLSATLPGLAHDKTLAEYAAIRYPPAATLRSDLGFLGYAPTVQAHLQPKKIQEASVDGARETPKLQFGARARARRTCHSRPEAESDCQGPIPQFH